MSQGANEANVTALLRRLLQAARVQQGVSPSRRSRHPRANIFVGVELHVALELFEEVAVVFSPSPRCHDPECQRSKTRTIGFFHPEHLLLAVGIIPPRSTFKTRIETEDRGISANSQGGSTTFQLPPLPRLPRRSTVKATECLIDVHLANEDQRRDKSPRAAAWTRWRLGVSVLRARVGKTLDFTFKTEPLPCVCRRRCSIVHGLLTLSPSQSGRAGLGVLIHPRSGAAAGPGLRAPIRSFVAPVQGQLP